jgi:hypothetical protein
MPAIISKLAVFVPALIIGLLMMAAILCGLGWNDFDRMDRITKVTTFWSPTLFLTLILDRFYRS